MAPTRSRRQLLVALAAVLTGCAGETGTPSRTPTPERRPTPASPTPTPTPTGTPTPTPTGTPTRTATPGVRARIHPVDTTFTVGTDLPVSYRVEAVESASVLGTGYGSFRPAGVFLLVELVVANVGERPVGIRRTDFSVVDDTGLIATVDTEATGRLPASRGTPHLVFRELAPGQRVTGWLVFDVPADTRGWRLLIRPPDRTAPSHAVLLTNTITLTEPPASPA